MKDGVIHDFAGPYTVGIDEMAFGEPTKYVQLDPELALVGSKKWNESVEKADETYSQMMHNLFCNNCHSHVACALNKMQYNG